jgi:hypothetical protein
VKNELFQEVVGRKKGFSENSTDIFFLILETTQSVNSAHNKTLLCFRG